MSLLLAFFLILLLVIVALGDAVTEGDTNLAAVARTVGPGMDTLATSTAFLYAASDVGDTNPPDSTSHLKGTPIVDSLIPALNSNKEEVTPSDDHKSTTIIIAFILGAAGLCIVLSVVFFAVRYYVRRTGIKRRRQASWILRSGRWNTEPKHAYPHGTQTGYSDTSSFSAYPYPLSEHF